MIANLPQQSVVNVHKLIMLCLVEEGGLSSSSEFTGDVMCSDPSFQPNITNMMVRL